MKKCIICYVQINKHKESKLNILVRNLPRGLTGDDLRQMFKPFGMIKSCTIVSDEGSGTSKGFGFVDMPDNDEAKAAIKALNGKLINNLKIRVKTGQPARKSFRDKPAGAKPERSEARGKGKVSGGKPDSTRSARPQRPGGKRTDSTRSAKPQRPGGGKSSSTRSAKPQRSNRKGRG